MAMTGGAEESGMNRWYQQHHQGNNSPNERVSDASNNDAMQQGANSPASSAVGSMPEANGLMDHHQQPDGSVFFSGVDASSSANVHDGAVNRARYYASQMHSAYGSAAPHHGNLPQ
jgi:hypothetical protein